jgi:hypothetical protein
LHPTVDDVRQRRQYDQPADEKSSISSHVQKTPHRRKSKSSSSAQRNRRFNENR